jgi:hypothetical protein
MQFNIIYGGRIEVYKNEDLFLSAEVKNRFKTHLSFYQNGKLILESKLSSFLIWRRVTIEYQDLPLPIDDFAQEKMFKFTMAFANHLITSIQRPLKKKGWLFYVDENEVAEIQYPKTVTLGYSKYSLISKSDDDTTNLYLLFAFLLPYTPT